MPGMRLIAAIFEVDASTIEVCSSHGDLIEGGKKVEFCRGGKNKNQSICPVCWNVIVDKLSLPEDMKVNQKVGV